LRFIILFRLYEQLSTVRQVNIGIHEILK